MPAPTIRNVIRLKKVGVLKDCPPTSFPRDFRRHNLIYGFNGSGKTTLSRLIDSLGDRGIAEKLDQNADFCFQLSDGSKPNSMALQSAASRFIAVFNEDYIERCLEWSNGTATAIIYVGEEQAELAKDLKKLEEQEREQSNAEILASSEYSSSDRELTNLARDIARSISEDLGLGRSYNAKNLKDDYAERSFGPDDNQPEDVKRALRQTINQKDLPRKISLQLGEASAQLVVTNAENSLSMSLTKLTLDSLERRTDALDWVRHGIGLHETEAECLFCGNSIPEDRLANLETALGSGFETLRSSIQVSIDRVRKFETQCKRNREALANIGIALPSNAETILQLRRQLSELYEKGELASREIIRSLEKKLGDPQSISSGPSFDAHSWDQILDDKISELQKEITENNNDIDNFSSEQEDARRKLKADRLASYDSAYRCTTLRVEENKKAYDFATEELKATQKQISEIKAQLRTHAPAAAAMNGLLRSYLGHEEIQLIPNREGYRLSRNGSLEPKPLSEGEKTAVAFCHFLATLKSEGRDPKDFVIVLDDPISSLDARAMTHAVSLIKQWFDESLQLFVLTHNLEFMREIKKWLNRRYKDGQADFLFIETTIIDGHRQSRVVEMPRLIREYESEYHYLYSLAKNLSDNPVEFEKFAYLMPNAIRKVLDIFLAFKVPGSSGLSPKVDKVLNDYPNLDAPRVKAMEHLAQLESHSESIGDTTTFSAFTLEQIREAAECLMQLIQEIDPQHKKAMDRLCR